MEYSLCDNNKSNSNIKYNNNYIVFVFWNYYLFFFLYIVFVIFDDYFYVLLVLYVFYTFFKYRFRKVIFFVKDYNVSE